MLAVVVPNFMFTIFYDFAADKLSRLRNQYAIIANMSMNSKKLIPLIP